MKTKTSGTKIVVTVQEVSKTKAKDLSEFLQEQAEIWVNREGLQKKFERLEKDENESFELS